MKKEIKKTIEQFHMVIPGDRILIGISGGADSVCLTQLLYELSKEYSFTLAAVHCHHGIRGQEADEDALFAQQFCEKRGIPFYFKKEDVRQRAEKERISEEEAGRNFRYETFLKIMKEQKLNKLAVAHNANDRAETMLFHLARGTNLSGLAAMEPKRQFAPGMDLIRPLLYMERREIEEWLLKREISWKTDGTNLTDLYTRNKIRHTILPALEEINPRTVRHMGETAEGIRETLSYLDGMEEQAWLSCHNENEKAILYLEPFSRLHVYLKKAVLYRWLSSLSGGRKDLEGIHVKLLLSLAEGASGRKISLPDHIEIKKEYDKLKAQKVSDPILHNQQNQLENVPVFIPLSAITPIKENNMVIETEILSENKQEILKKKYTKFFDCDKIKNGLCLRFWKPGDYICLREDGGRKKLNRYFIDEKIPPSERGKIYLLADGNHILWMIGYRISGYYKVTEKTENILSVTVKCIEKTKDRKGEDHVR
ncbi:MAG: tRNA lysidine(34) synthetase TilS [Lachnospiraceae bacterium]|nr:tRNA lysidine(34) synthetase TilS [Lachnospiraceae bacterium]